MKCTATAKKDVVIGGVLVTIGSELDIDPKTLGVSKMFYPTPPPDYNYSIEFSPSHPSYHPIIVTVQPTALYKIMGVPHMITGEHFIFVVKPD